MGLDQWEDLTIGNLLGDNIGGYTKAILEYKNQLVAQLNKINSTLAVIQSRIGSINGFLNTTNDILSGLTSSGFYIIYLSPGDGNWSSRLLSATGAPNQLGYATGLCAIAKAPNLATVQTKYNDMMKVLSTPLPF